MDVSGNLSSATDLIMEYVVNYGMKFLGAILALIIGLWIVGLISKSLRKVMEKREVDPSLRGFLGTFLSIVLKILVIISVLGMVGIQMTSFIAILGAASLAVGLSLQGSLQNFAGGIIILILKPFRVGDFIDAQGHLGTVEDIKIFTTQLKTVDNKVIFIPNGDLANSSITNFSIKETRRVEWTFGIAYGDSYDKAREVLQRLIDEDSRIHRDPEPFIRLTSLGDSSVNIVVRVWLNAADYWEVFFDMNEKVYKAFSEEGINIPFPQMDVHLHQEE
ncbi:MAG: mechanosensitive ion channel [Bacteroidetes bacterium]|nr:mechanosensitive ion channel [Bacteroidota bacterium]MBU1578433.1 mechanosensitive ion channel [Bacteroidota bacterium]MBU2465195.1 mechanosensitive ion channel [Bacteroidota bacterium]MBU2557517.1 mechanosensitive ion channel [Bacteroidota bacterium]